MAMLFFPLAREGGLGRIFQTQVQGGGFVLATIGTVVLAGLLDGVRGLVACGVIWCLSHLLGVWWTRMLGGLTGDTYGALCEITETATLGILAAWL